MLFPGVQLSKVSRCLVLTVVPLLALFPEPYHCRLYPLVVTFHSFFSSLNRSWLLSTFLALSQECCRIVFNDWATTIPDLLCSATSTRLDIHATGDFHDFHTLYLCDWFSRMLVPLRRERHISHRDSKNSLSCLSYIPFVPVYYIPLLCVWLFLLCFFCTFCMSLHLPVCLFWLWLNWFLMLGLETTYS